MLLGLIYLLERVLVTTWFCYFLHHSLLIFVQQLKVATVAVNGIIHLAFKFH